ncbi:hypothetical protein BDF22DRAFT_667826, partial [Syncephalis plumigaleata]
MLGLPIFLKVELEPARDNYADFDESPPYTPNERQQQQQQQSQYFLHRRSVDQLLFSRDSEERHTEATRANNNDIHHTSNNNNNNDDDDDDDDGPIPYSLGRLDSRIVQSVSNLDSIPPVPDYNSEHAHPITNRDPLVIGMLGRTPSYICGRVRISWKASSRAAQRRNHNSNRDGDGTSNANTSNSGIHVESPYQPLELKLRFRGNAHVYQGYKFASTQRSYHNMFIIRSKVADKKITLWGSNQQQSSNGGNDTAAQPKPIYDPVKQRYTMVVPFRFPISDMLPNSFSSSFGTISYSLKAKLAYKFSSFFSTSFRMNTAVSRPVRIRRWLGFEQSEMDTSVLARSIGLQASRLGYAYTCRISRSYYAGHDMAMISICIGPGLTDLSDVDYASDDTLSDNSRSRSSSGSSPTSAHQSNHVDMTQLLSSPPPTYDIAINSPLDATSPTSNDTNHQRPRLQTATSQLIAEHGWSNDQANNASAINVRPNAELRRIVVRLVRRERVNAAEYEAKSSTVVRERTYTPASFDLVTKTYQQTIRFPIPLVEAPTVRSSAFNADYVITVSFVMRGASDATAELPIKLLPITRDERRMTADSQYGLPAHLRILNDSNNIAPHLLAQHVSNQLSNQIYTEPPPPYSA